MIELSLTITNIALLITLAVSLYINSKEKEKLIKMILAKNLQEVTENEIIEKFLKAKDKPYDLPENVPLDPNDVENFDKSIKQVLDQERQDLEAEHAEQ